MAQLSTCENDNTYAHYLVQGQMMNVEHLSALAWERVAPDISSTLQISTEWQNLLGLPLITEHMLQAKSRWQAKFDRARPSWDQYVKSNNVHLCQPAHNSQWAVDILRGALNVCPVDWGLSFKNLKMQTASSFIQSESMSGGNGELVGGKKASTMYHGEVLKSNNDSKAVLGNCTEGALAGRKKKGRSIHASHSLSLCFSHWQLVLNPHSHTQTEGSPYYLIWIKEQDNVYR